MKYKFRNNEDVAHIENLDQKMIVKRILYTEVNIGNKKEKKIRGVLCYWFENGKFKENVFHAERLVSWIFALKGKSAAEQWLKDMGAKSVEP